MGYLKCKAICEKMAVRVTSNSRRFGKLRRFAKFHLGERKCRYCAAVYTKEQNFLLCPCCSSKLAY